MSNFVDLRAAFSINWTTVLVGWVGFGIFSPWPDRWIKFPSLVSEDEVEGYAVERLNNSTKWTEIELISELRSLGVQKESRERIRFALEPLSNFDEGNSAIELRKWRVILLEDYLKDLPNEPLYGLVALSEFWQIMGFPSDSPHEVQGRENSIDPAVYYTADNFQAALKHHRLWAKQEKAVLSG